MAETSTEIAIIRHPETVANTEGRFVGHGDSEITERGRQQLLALTTAMDAWRPTAVFTSPLRRALVAAQTITACGVPITVLEDLQEIDFGRAEGLTWNEITSLGMAVDYLPNGAASSGVPASELDGPGDGAVAPGGESWANFEARVIRAATTVESAGSRVAIVTHGGVFRTLIAHWLGLPMEASWRFAVGNGAIATVRVSDGAGVLTSLTADAV
ncbi:MAG: histidine phosphatase family protein [Coriobacteriia bacterium]